MRTAKQPVVVPNMTFPGPTVGEFLIGVAVLNTALIVSLCFVTSLRCWFYTGIGGLMIDACAAIAVQTGVWIIGQTTMLRRRMEQIKICAVTCTVISGVSGLILRLIG